MINIAKAFIAAQKEMGNAIKDSKNPFFKSAYADLNSVREACLPALNANGIAVLQPIIQVDGKNFVKTLLLHESGESIEGLTEILFAKQNDPQAQGSGITYARRYGLQSLVNIGAEDDDGNKAAEKPKEAKKESTKNAFGLSKDGDLASGADMTETLENKNKELVKRLTARINQMGSAAELQGWLEEKAVKTAYAKLDKYFSEGFAEVKKTELSKFQELDPND
jgi:hypothetical protein